MNYAPIVLFVYNRPRHAKQVIESIRGNSEACESNLVIYSDATRSAGETKAVCEVRQYIHKIRGFKSVRIVERATNYGLARSIVDGVSAIIGEYGRLIAVEDDIVVSRHFLRYMNEALDRFADDDRVACIHGYAPPIKKNLPEAYFLPGADCWGWATWNRAWECFTPDGQYLLDELKRRRMTRVLDYDGAYPFSGMLQDQINGINDSWAVRWHASALLAGKLTLHPGRSLVHNIGNDKSGAHCGISPELDAELSQSPIDLSSIAVEPCAWCWRAHREFFRSIQGSWPRRMVRKIRAWLVRRRQNKPGTHN